MSDPKYVAIIRVPVYANDEAEALARITPYVRDMQVEADVEIRNASDHAIIDIDGGTIRVKLKEPEKFIDGSPLALLRDYDFQLIDRNGIAQDIPMLTSELTISFKGEEHIPQVRLQINRV